MEVVYSAQAREDISFWKSSGNKKVMHRISLLINDIKLNPFEGLGKPESLKYDLQGCWSRRIDKEHRLIYRIFENKVEVISMRFHYK